MADVTGKSPNAPTAKADPLLTFMFSVEAEVSLPIKNAETNQVSYETETLTGFFTELSNIGDENDLVEFKASDSGRDVTILLPGRLNTNEITLKRGITKDLAFWKWRQTVRDGKIDDARTTVTIGMYNRAYERLVEWTLTYAWPSQISGPDFQAGSSDFGVEEITIVYHDLLFDEASTEAEAASA